MITPPNLLASCVKHVILIMLVGVKAGATQGLEDPNQTAPAMQTAYNIADEPFL